MALTPEEIGIGDWLERRLENLFEEIDYYRERERWSVQKMVELIDDQMMYMDGEDWAGWYYAQVRNNDE